MQRRHHRGRLLGRVEQRQLSGHLPQRVRQGQRVLRVDHRLTTKCLTKGHVHINGLIQ